MERIPCENCGAKVLPSTIEKTNGYCMPCFKGSNRKSFSERAEDIAVRMGMMKDSDRVAHKGFSESEIAASLASVGPIDYGRSMNDILAHRDQVDDAFLVSHMDGLLIQKENEEGFDSFTEQERIFYVIADVIREVNSGGFGAYFYNCGNLAHMLINALDNIGSRECRDLAFDALSIYGKTPASDYDEMLEELARITNNFENNPWDEQDDRFVNMEEDLDKLLMDYVQNNSGEFQL